MKLNKLFAGVLAAAMMMSIGVSAMATDTDTVNKTYLDMDTAVLVKNYQLSGAGISPEETFKFSELTCTEVKNAGVVNGQVVTKDTAPVPTIDNVTFERGAAGNEEKMTGLIKIHLPEYPAVGVYTYTFSETDNKTAGVSYYNKDIRLVVTVIEQDGKTRVAAVHTEEGEVSETNPKSYTFDNTYTANTLTVSKTVNGLMGDKNKEFTFTVKFEAPEGKTWNPDLIVTEYNKTESNGLIGGLNGVVGLSQMSSDKEFTFTLKDGEYITFENLPEGVKYTVTEENYASEGYETSSVDNNTKKDSIMHDEAIEVAFTNSKAGTVDTGVILDNAPYIVMLAVVAGGVLFVAGKKRREE